MSSKRIKNWIIAIIVAIIYLIISFTFKAWTYSWIIWVSYSIYRFVDKNKTKNSNNSDAFIFIVIILTIIILASPAVISIVLYNNTFGTRYETYKPFSYSIEDFKDLKRKKYEIISNKGQQLIGYNYYKDNIDIKGIVVISHGFGGGGHNSYMDCANYFTNSGYNVFAFDITGNDESEGKEIGGLPQGVIDLSYVISFIQEQEEFKNLPIMLFGHSWGGYSVANVLNYHPEVKAIVSLSGFNKSSDLIKDWGQNMVGDFINIAMPYLELYEKIKFGEYAQNTAMSGFEKSNAGVMIIHSEDDTVVNKKYGYDVYYDKYANDDRFKFILYKDKGHNEIYYSKEAKEYINQFNKEYKENYNVFENNIEEKEQYIKNNLDRNIWNNLLDEELFKNIVEFYDSYL